MSKNCQKSSKMAKNCPKFDKIWKMQTPVERREKKSAKFGFPEFRRKMQFWRGVFSPPGEICTKSAISGDVLQKNEKAVYSPPGGEGACVFSQFLFFTPARYSQLWRKYRKSRIRTKYIVYLWNTTFFEKNSAFYPPWRRVNTQKFTLKYIVFAHFYGFTL